MANKRPEMLGEASQQERPVGHVSSEARQLNEDVRSLESELDGLATVLAPVLRSPTPQPACDKEESEPRSDCQLAKEIASIRQTVLELIKTILDLKERLEV